MVAHNSCSKREEINAEWISNQAYKMIKDLIDIEERTTLHYTFYNIAMKTGFEVGQIKRIYYKE
ncbi:unnamed protein product [Commensalibacter communis]|uniref:hypothetical protein n=1 Tax=Commensalibacter communis TaxID=2972786 RepID=UPI0022FFAD30|nr:hypothetical protein [Commensalibacter communis]CAI3940374.1 unnamed protein product [Commensalibacter communis]